MVTSPKIVFVVVGTLAIMASTYIGTLAWCVINNVQPEGDLIRSFEAAGIYVLGAFTGILANTRTQAQPAENPPLVPHHPPSPPPLPPPTPTPVQVVNEPSKPVPTVTQPGR